MSEKRAFLITNPMIAANRSAEVTLSKFLRVIRPCYDSLSVVGGNLRVEADVGEVTLYSYPIARASNKLRRIWDVAVLQFKMSACVLSRIRRREAVYFWLGDKMLLPYLAAKCKGADIRFFIYGNVEKEENAGTFSKLSGKLIRFMAEHADSVCVESPGVLADWVGLKPRRLRVLHLYNDIPAAADPLREPIFGMLCRLAVSKRVPESIEAFSRVHALHPKWKLEIIGAGKLESQCREQIHRLNAEAYITLHGWVEHRQLHAITKRWKYLLFPTDCEGLPNGLIEMMGQGIPAIASPVGGVVDVVAEGVNGWLLEDNTVCGIEKGILKAIASSDAQMAENARQMILKEYSLSAAQKQAAEAI